MMDICKKKYKNTSDTELENNNLEVVEQQKNYFDKNDFIKINYPEEHMLKYNDSVVISCCNNFLEDVFDNNSLNHLKRNDLSFDLLDAENEIDEFDKYKKIEDSFFELINESEPENNFENNFENNLNLDDTLIKFYEMEEDIEIKKSSNYNNEHFCYYCKNYMIMPENEIINFFNFHLTQKKYSKYLMLVFRLCPHIFSYQYVMNNKHLRKYIHNYLNLDDDKSNDPNEKMLKDIVIFSQYEIKTKQCNSSHIYENIFHQPYLKYCDYLKCDSCKNYVCPIHSYLSKFYFGVCNICKSKKWSICGWCKYNFNEVLGCKYIHQKN